MSISASQQAVARATEQRRLMIVAHLPEFISREFSWFAQHSNKIEALVKKERWWRNHVFFVEKEQRISPIELKKKLVERGYVNMQRPHERGTFSHTGGVLTIAPVNSERLVRIDFSGSIIDTITLLPQKTSAPKTPGEATPRFYASDYVVHRDHGIGICAGTTDELDSYWEIRYAKGDKIFVPFSQSHKLTLYLGFSEPTVRRLNSTVWQKVRTKTKYDVVSFAKKLLQHYKKRSSKRGFAFAPNSAEMRELADSFPYPLTSDQERAWDEIATDMESSQVMDRLLAGDVGFGKTELAVRAAYKAVLSGKQVALLAPTTILAYQHAQTFTERLSAHSASIKLLSRLSSAQEQRELVTHLKDGAIDIVVGTHRLLSNDVGFDNLGLLIIDEEQRFGVSQKEKISMLRDNVDILMLSATPIPRTLAAALAGFKDISQLSSSPPGRQNTTTTVKPFSWNAVSAAVLRERERGGQVFFLENRIGRIADRLNELKKHLPNTIRYGTLHGRMREEDIVATLEAFRTKKIHILITTTIIENGLDFPNANTLIVADATRLGLTQAHQLRGRIGRADNRGYATFLYPQKRLTQKASGRLELLKQYSELGDGFALAMQDLKLRGAGNILGKEQSGRVNSVGLHLYMQMLNEAVRELE